MKFTANKILASADVAEHYNEVIDEIYIENKPKYKIVRFIFKDGSSVDVEYTLSSSKIISKTDGNLPIRQYFRCESNNSK